MSGKGLREMGKRGLHRGILASEFQFHHLKGEEGISCVSFSHFELFDDVRPLINCRVIDPFGVHT